jgi:uncharacterized protein DUF5678
LLTLTTDVINVVMSSSAAKKPVYLRGLPSDVVREAKAAAARRGVTLAGFVAETLARALRQPEARPEKDAESDSGLRADMRWYEKNRESITREYGGEYIAVIDRKVVDHDESFEALAERVFASEGPRNIFMPLVESTKRPLRVASPRQSRRSSRRAR